jgi:hypothetical protein
MESFMTTTQELRPGDKTLPDASERLRVNMGWQCPECFGPNIKMPKRQHHECQDCGCQWDRRYYPSLKVI